MHTVHCVISYHPSYFFTVASNYLLYLTAICTNFTPRIPNILPNIAPANTSDGKCTYRYNLENAIKTAHTPAITLYLRLIGIIQTTAKNSNAAIVCPEGNE